MLKMGCVQNADCQPQVERLYQTTMNRQGGDFSSPRGTLVILDGLGNGFSGPYISSGARFLAIAPGALDATYKGTATGPLTDRADDAIEGIRVTPGLNIY